jgi:hypothetical protein
VAIEAGTVPTSFLEAMNMLNSTYGLDPSVVRDAGMQRWMMHTNMFVPGLVDTQTGTYPAPQRNLEHNDEDNDENSVNQMSVDTHEDGTIEAGNEDEEDADVRRNAHRHSEIDEDELFPWRENHIMHIEQLLPKMHDDVFYRYVSCVDVAIV